MVSERPGGRLGHYEIPALVGAGAMGEVYRAHDTQLERDVAIKVLPRALANDPERLARFDREAKVLAALNHSNIAVIVMAVNYTAHADSFAAGKPRVWTEARLRNSSAFSNYDLAPDGKHLAAFLADDANGQKPLTHLTFLPNFFDELRRRAR